MAQIVLGADNLTKVAWRDSQGNPIAGFRCIGEETTSAFTVLFLNKGSVTYYYWPNTSGVLRYGATEPTVATQDSAGGAV